MHQTVNAAAKCKVTIKKLNGKSLSTTKNIKVYVAAYRTVETKNGETITKTAKVGAKTVLQYPKKKQLSDAHAKEFRYASSDKSIATISKTRKITAMKKGSCIIYVYGRNAVVERASKENGSQ